MLEFIPIKLEDREHIDPIMQQDGTISSGRTFSSLYIWGEYYRTCCCRHGGALFLKACDHDDILTYYMPLGGDMATAVGVLEQDAEMRGLPYEITLLTDDGREELERLFPGKYVFSEMRSAYDYVYNAADLIELKGKKYHGKRNFINRFMMTYAGRWAYEPVDARRDRDEILEFVRHWCEERRDEDPTDYRYEYSAIWRALEYFEALNIRGGILRLDGRMIAFTLATPQNDRAIDILIEKADADIEGAYQMINNQFAQRECAGFTYINREEDMGIEGLRRAKLSYYPAFLTAKYRAVPAR